MSSTAASTDRLEPIAAAGNRVAGVGQVLAFAGLSVALAIVITLPGVGVPSALVPFLLAFVPLVFALAFAWREGNGAIGRLLRSAVKTPTRRSAYLVLALPVVWAFGVVAVAFALGEPTTGVFDDVFPRILFIALLVLLPAFGEEIAWRGWAVNRLLPAMSPLAAALVLGVPWAVIHVFLQLPGQMNAGLETWPTVLSLLAYSVILTWIYVASGGSVLLTALVHAGLNGVAPLMANLETDRAWIVRAVLAAAIAVAVIVASRVMRNAPDREQHIQVGLDT